MTAATAALVRERGGSVTLADVTVGAPGPGQVLVQIAASGVCATDLFGIAGGAGDRFPAVFGHEGAGVVVAVGDGEADTDAAVVGSVADHGARGRSPLRVGDRVVLSYDSCRACPSCVAGHPASCVRFGELNYAERTDLTTADGAPVTTGWMAQSSWATHVLVTARSVVRIGDDVPWPVAATLGCGALTGAGTVLNVLRPGPTDSLLVIGAGMVGLSAVMAARHRGVAAITVVEPNSQRRALALEVGATVALGPDEVSHTRPRLSATHVLDGVGSQSALDLAMRVLVSGGTCATVALRAGANDLTLAQSRLLWGRTLTGVIEGDSDIARDIPLLVALWRAGRLPLERLITPFAFDRIDEAVAAAREGDVVKAVVLMTTDAGSPDTSASAPNAADRLPHPAAVPGLGTIDLDDLPGLWRSLPPVDPAELTGLWRGTGLSREHAAHRLLERSGWFGKLFRSAGDVAPIVCADADGRLFVDRKTARGGASVIRAEHAGILTAAMVYDGQPIVDFFTRLGPDAVLGVMTGRGTLDAGRSYHFVLERVADADAADVRDEPPSADNPAR